MLREYTYIICPNGCDMRAQTEEREDGTRRIYFVEGAACPKGGACVEQEVTAPHGNIAVSVLVKDGILPLASMRLISPTPRGRIFDAMDRVKRCTLTTPVKTGTAVILHLLGYDVDVIMTKPVPENRCR